MGCFKITLLFITFVGYVSAKGYSTGLGRPGNVQERIGAGFGGGVAPGYGGEMRSNLAGGIHSNLGSGLQRGLQQSNIGSGMLPNLGGGVPSGYGPSAQMPLGGGIGPANRGGLQSILGGGRRGGADQEKQYPPRPFNMDYNNVDEQGNVQFRQEQGDGSGNVKGTYGYQDTQGLYRTVEYVAGADGFKASVQTNEPGTDGKESPADTTFIVNPAPAGIQDQYTRQAGIGGGGGYNSGMRQGFSGIGGGLNAYGSGVGPAAGRMGPGGIGQRLGVGPAAGRMGPGGIGQRLGVGPAAGRMGSGGIGQRLGAGPNQGSGLGMKMNKGSPVLPYGVNSGSGVGGVPSYGANPGTQSFGGPSGAAPTFLSQSLMRISDPNSGVQGIPSGVSQGQGVKSGKSGY